MFIYESWAAYPGENPTSLDFFQAQVHVFHVFGGSSTGAKGPYSASFGLCTVSTANHNLISIDVARHLYGYACIPIKYHWSAEVVHRGIQHCLIWSQHYLVWSCKRYELLGHTYYAAFCWGYLIWSWQYLIWSCKRYELLGHAYYATFSWLISRPMHSLQYPNILLSIVMPTTH